MLLAKLDAWTGALLEELSIGALLALLIVKSELAVAVTSGLSPTQALIVANIDVLTSSLTSLIG